MFSFNKANIFSSSSIGNLSNNTNSNQSNNQSFSNFSINQNSQSNKFDSNNSHKNPEQKKQQEEKEKNFEDFIKKISKKLKEEKPNSNVTKMIENNSKLSKKILEDIIEENLDSNQIKEIPSFIQGNNIRHLTPNFSAFSNKLQLNFLFFPYETKNILLIFSKEKLIKKIEIIFERKNDESTFAIEKIIMNQANQNEIAFFSDKKISILTEIDKLIDSNDTRINIDFNLTVKDLFFSNNINHTNSLKFLQFYFWDFEKHFGILTNDDVIRIFNYNENNVELIYEFDSEIVKNQTGVIHSKFTDFQFADAKSSHFLEAFSLIILDFTGKIFTVKYIFPLELNLNSFKNLHEKMTFVRFLDIYKKEKMEKIENANGKTFNFNINKKTEKENYFHLEIFIIDQITSQIKPENKHLINMYYLIDLFKNKKLHQIEELSIIEKRENFSKFERINKEFHSNNQKKYFSKLKIITTTPLSLIRVFKDDSLDIILSNKQIFADENLNLNSKNFAYLISTENFSANYFPNEEQKLFLVDNHLTKNHYLIVNFINDVYLLNLKFLKKISKNFLKGKTKKLMENFKKDSICSLIPYLKFDYSKIKNFKNKIFGYFGINFFSLNENKKKFILFGINFDQEFFCREFKLYSNEKEISEDFKFLQNKEKFEKKELTEENLLGQLDLKVTRKLNKNEESGFVSLNKIKDL